MGVTAKRNEWNFRIFAFYLWSQLRQVFKSWTKNCIFKIQIKVASTKMVSNICYVMLLRVDRSFRSFGKKLSPKYLVIIRMFGPKCCWKCQFKGFIVKIRFIWSLLDHYLIMINFLGFGNFASYNFFRSSETRNVHIRRMASMIRLNALTGRLWTSLHP